MSIKVICIDCISYKCKIKISIKEHIHIDGLAIAFIVCYKLPNIKIKPVKPVFHGNDNVFWTIHYFLTCEIIFKNVYDFTVYTASWLLFGTQVECTN